MTDDLEHRLAARLGGRLPGAPSALVEALGRLPIEHPRTSPAGPSRGALIMKVAVVVLAVGLFWFFLPRQGPSAPANPSSSPTVASPHPSPTAASPLSPSPTAVAIDSWTVSEFLRRRDAGTLPDGPITLAGYWTDRSVVHSCPAPRPEQYGDLVIWCREGEYGITERDEPIRTWHLGGSSTMASGPWITPYIENDESMRPLFSQPVINGQPYPPVPIVVVGHVNDPRAEDCGSEVLQTCRDRFVIDEIFVFEPQAVPTPAPTPSPTPFPFEDPPPAQFGKDMCAGDVPYAFVGWGKLSEHGVVDRGDDHVVFMMATRDPENIPGETGPPRRIVCFSYEWDEGLAIEYAFLP